MSTRVLTTGVFDLFHVGHLRALLKAKALGDYLIVGVIGDAHAQEYKRLPIVPFAQRLEIVSAIDCVDEVFECSAYIPLELYRQHRVDIHCQGDQVLDHCECGEKLGIVRYLGRDHSVDTTRLIQRVLDRQ